MLLTRYGSTGSGTGSATLLHYVLFLSFNPHPQLSGGSSEVSAPLHNLCYNTLIVHFQNALFEMMFAEDTIFDVVGNFLRSFMFKIKDYGLYRYAFVEGGGAVLQLYK
jgi:hypothetical protein